MKLATEIYRVTQEFPKSEIYGLTNQIRRSAVSIPSNIAEGYAYRSDRYLRHFLDIALGSAAELETQLKIAKDVSYLAEVDHLRLDQKLDEIGKMVRSLMQKLNK